jgi:hypothetical protein
VSPNLGCADRNLSAVRRQCFYLALLLSCSPVVLPYPLHICIGCHLRSLQDTSKMCSNGRGRQQPRQENRLKISTWIMLRELRTRPPNTVPFCQQALISAGSLDRRQGINDPLNHHQNCPVVLPNRGTLSYPELQNCIGSSIDFRSKGRPICI